MSTKHVENYLQFSIKKINSTILSGIHTLISNPLADENNIYVEARPSLFPGRATLCDNVASADK